MRKIAETKKPTQERHRFQGSTNSNGLEVQIRYKDVENRVRAGYQMVMLTLILGNVWPVRQTDL